MEQYLIIVVGILLIWGGVLTGYIIGARSWERNNRRSQSLELGAFKGQDLYPNHEK